MVVEGGWSVESLGHTTHSNRERAFKGHKAASASIGTGPKSGVKKCFPSF